MWTNIVNIIACFIFLYAILAISATLTTGLSNLLTMCQAAFYGIGAYVGMFLLNHFNVSFLVVSLLVMIVTGLSSLIVSYASIRLKGDAFILATLGFQMMVFSTIWNTNIPGGPSGPSGYSAEAPIKVMGTIPLAQNDHWILMLAVLLITIMLFGFYQRTPYGRLLRAIRVNNEYVEAMGKDTRILKIQTFFISAAFSGLAGLLYASWMRYIDPKILSLDMSILVITALFLGGKDHWKGALLGSVIVLMLPNLFNFISEQSTQSVKLVTVVSNAGQALYGLTLIVLMFRRPQGLVVNKGRSCKIGTKIANLFSRLWPLLEKENSRFVCEKPSAESILELKNVKYSYKSGLETVNLLDGGVVKIEKGKTTALVGCNGAGKTTLFNIISGFEKRFQGEVFFNGQCITHVPSCKRSRMGVARLFQGVQLMPDLTLREYLVMSAQDHRLGENPFIAPFIPRRIKKWEKEKTQRALDLLNVFFGSYEGDLRKYYSKLDEKTSALSYGEQRIMAFVGLLMSIDGSKETLLLLDEPTSGVNKRYTESMKSILRRYIDQKRVSVLMIEHRMSFVSDVAANAIFLAGDTGKLEGGLTPELLMKNNQFRKNYLGYGKND